jgi:antitoxin (DNA-binding transcriptional repressor) of toxin-antitoxin stability system
VKKLRLSSAVRPLADYIADFQDETVVVTEGNRAVAAIVPLKNVDRESLALSQHPEFLELIARSRADFAVGRTISLGEMKRRVLPRRSPNKRLQPTARRPRRG